MTFYVEMMSEFHVLIHLLGVLHTVSDPHDFDS